MRAALLTDGISDGPLASVIERVAHVAEVELDVTPIGVAELSPQVGRRVAHRVRALLNFDDSFEVVCVHRDAESKDPEPRYQEIEQGVSEAGFTGRCVPVVPVRMTESWLLLDEQAIRTVAGAPSRSHALSLPNVREAERLADAKAALQRTLITAAGSPTGRNLTRFRSQFGSHRAQLLRRLDPNGAVAQLGSFQRLVSSVESLRGE